MGRRFYCRIGGNRIVGTLSLYFLASVVFGQTVPSQVAALKAFNQEQADLTQGLQQLVAQGATPQKIQAWIEKNNGRFAAQQQLAQVLAVQSALRSLPTVAPPIIPANSSQTMKDFLTAQASLENSRIQIHNQLLRSMPANATPSQLTMMRWQEMQLFEQQNKNALKLQAQLSQSLSKELATHSLLDPPPLRIPAHASPQLATYLATLDQLRRKQVQLSNNIASADAQTRSAAVQQWSEQNAALIQQMQQQSLNLSDSRPNPPAN